jgi:hypothetical protein
MGAGGARGGEGHTGVGGVARARGVLLVAGAEEVPEVAGAAALHLEREGDALAERGVGGDEGGAGAGAEPGERQGDEVAADEEVSDEVLDAVELREVRAGVDLDFLGMSSRCPRRVAPDKVGGRRTRGPPSPGDTLT